MVPPDAWWALLRSLAPNYIMFITSTTTTTMRGVVCYRALFKGKAKSSKQVANNLKRTICEQFQKQRKQFQKGPNGPVWTLLELFSNLFLNFSKIVLFNLFATV